MPVGKNRGIDKERGQKRGRGRGERSLGFLVGRDWEEDELEDEKG